MNVIVVGWKGTALLMLASHSPNSFVVHCECRGAFFACTFWMFCLTIKKVKARNTNTQWMNEWQWQYGVFEWILGTDGRREGDRPGWQQRNQQPLLLIRYIQPSQPAIDKPLPNQSSGGLHLFVCLSASLNCANAFRWCRRAVRQMCCCRKNDVCLIVCCYASSPSSSSLHHSLHHSTIVSGKFRLFRRSAQKKTTTIRHTCLV